MNFSQLYPLTDCASSNWWFIDDQGQLKQKPKPIEQGSLLQRFIKFFGFGREGYQTILHTIETAYKKSLQELLINQDLPNIQEILRRLRTSTLIKPEEFDQLKLIQNLKDLEEQRTKAIRQVDERFFRGSKRTLFKCYYVGSLILTGLLEIPSYIKSLFVGSSYPAFMHGIDLNSVGRLYIDQLFASNKNNEKVVLCQTNEFCLRVEIEQHHFKLIWVDKKTAIASFIRCHFEAVKRQEMILLNADAMTLSPADPVAMQTLSQLVKKLAEEENAAITVEFNSSNHSKSSHLEKLKHVQIPHSTREQLNSWQMIFTQINRSLGPQAETSWSPINFIKCLSRT